MDRKWLVAASIAVLASAAFAFRSPVKSLRDLEPKLAEVSGVRTDSCGSGSMPWRRCTSKWFEVKRSIADVLPELVAELRAQGWKPVHERDSKISFLRREGTASCLVRIYARSPEETTVSMFDSDWGLGF